MEEVIKIFQQIKNTSGLNDKKSIIVANKNNELFKKCLVFLLDPNIQTGLSTKKIAKKVRKTEYILPTFEDVMQYLQNHNTGTDDDIMMIQGFINNQPEEYHTFYTELITKKYKLGCDKKVVNNVILGLIPSWDIQQAFPISDKNKPKDGDWFALSQKINGVNCSWKKGELISRQGKTFTGLTHIINDLRRLPRIDDFFINGELVRKNYDNLSDDENFRIGTGIINSDDADKSSIKFIIYEILPVEEFEKGESKLKYKERRNLVLNPFSTTVARLDTDNIEVLPLVYEGTDQSVIQPLLDKADADGWEGLMLNKDAKWKNKRNNGILKVKSFKDISLRVIGIEEGDGANKGKLGAVVCKYYNNTVNCGSGFTDEQRDYYWQHKDEILNKIIDIKYKTVSMDKKTGLKSLQFLTFMSIRIDKSIPDDEETM